MHNVARDISSSRETIRRFLALEDGVEGLAASVVAQADSTESLRRSITDLSRKASELPKLNWWQRMSHRWFK